MASIPDDVFSAAPIIVDGDVLEAAKENIQPLASGRRVTALSAILTTPHAQRDATLAATKRRFRVSIERALTYAASDDRDQCSDSENEDEDSLETDPLSAYSAFVTWTLENYPQGQSAESGLLELLEEATRALKDVGGGCYRQETRYLKLWTLYAGFVERPALVWRFLLANEIGTCWATLYEGFALSLERDGRRQEADSIYLLGIARRAEPLERLQIKHREFQKRMMANTSSSSTAVPAPTAVPPTATTRRTVLGETARRLAPAVPRPNARMQIFVDADDSASTADAGVAAAADARPGAGAWPELGTRVSRVKENVPEVRRMAGTTVRTAKARVPSASASTSGARAGFAVFRDTESAPEEAMPPPAVPAARPVKRDTGKAAGKAPTPAKASFTPFRDEAPAVGAGTASFAPFRDAPSGSGSGPAVPSTPSARFTPYRDEPSASTTMQAPAPGTPSSSASVMQPKATPGPGIASARKGKADSEVVVAEAATEAEALRRDPLKNYGQEEVRRAVELELDTLSARVSAGGDT